MIPLLKKEFSSNRVSLVFYCLFIIGLTWMYTALYPAIQRQSEVLSKTLESFGGAIKAFGIKDIGFDTIEKFFATELFGATWPILAITFVTARAGQAFSGEIEKGTMGLILSLPLSRLKIYATKYLAGLLSISLFVIVTSAATPLIAFVYGIEFQLVSFASLALISFLFCWTVYSLTVLLSTIFSEKGHVYVTLGGIIMLMYVANVITILNDDVAWLRYSSIFHYFTASEALISNHIVFSSVAVFSAAILVTTFAGAVRFVKRDVVV